MKMWYLGRWTTISIALMVCLPVTASAQPVKIPFHREPHFVHSGFHDGSTDSTAQSFIAFREVIRVPGAPWLRLQFQAYDLQTSGKETIEC